MKCLSLRVRYDVKRTSKFRFDICDLMTDVFKIMVKYRRKIIAKYRHLSPSGNRALTPMLVVQIRQGLLIVILSVVKLFSFFVKS